LSDYFVGGVQVEGGFSNIRARLTGNGSSSSLSTSTSTFVLSSTSPASSSTSISGGGGTQSLSDTLANRWQISALARGGFLIDPYELVYLTGGWTYAGFETLQQRPTRT